MSAPEVQEAPATEAPAAPVIETVPAALAHDFHRAELAVRQADAEYKRISAQLSAAREACVKALGVLEYIQGKLVGEHGLKLGDSIDETGKITRGENASA